MRVYLWPPYTCFCESQACLEPWSSCQDPWPHPSEQQDGKWGWYWFDLVSASSAMAWRDARWRWIVVLNLGIFCCCLQLFLFCSEIRSYYAALAGLESAILHTHTLARNSQRSSSFYLSARLVPPCLVVIWFLDWLLAFRGEKLMFYFWYTV